MEFSSSFVANVGNGIDIGFWVDKWVGDSKLCDMFPRLYHLDRRKEGRVAKKGNGWMMGGNGNWIGLEIYEGWFARSSKIYL